MACGQVRVVIPMKPLAASKRRLAGTVDPRRRALLSLWMLERVASAAQDCLAVGEVAVVGGDTAVAALCRELGTRWEPDPAWDLNSALDAALRRSRARGWAQMLFLPGDLPGLATAEVADLVDASGGQRLVLAPAARGGTNAILVPLRQSTVDSRQSTVPSPACNLQPSTSSLGVPRWRFQLGPDSFRRHCAQATSLALEWRTFRGAGLEADVDIPEDVARLEQAEPDLWRVAARMERFLAARPALVRGACRI
ncbi:MAG: NTP transferase domain-containing protein [Chloroflexi bacterium]|nr:NTP transferase domain-containing protein [Chloroflexota bacterium]